MPVQREHGPHRLLLLVQLARAKIWMRLVNP